MTTESATMRDKNGIAVSDHRPAGSSRRTGGSAPGRQVKRRSQRATDNIAGYLFLSPWLVGFVVLTAGPMLVSLYLAFTSYNLFTAPEWIGFDNFTRMAQDEKFWDS